MSDAEGHPLETLQLPNGVDSEGFYDEQVIYKTDDWRFLGDGDFNPQDISFCTFDKMRNEDSQVNAGLRIIVLGALARGWELHYGGNQPELGKDMIGYLNQVFDGVNTTQWRQGGLTQWMEEIIEVSLAFGFSSSEMVYNIIQYQGESKIGLKKLKTVPAMTVENGLLWNNVGDLTKIIQRVNGNKNELDMERMLMWSYRMEGANWYGKSDLRQIYKNWYIKDFIMKMWNIAIERYGTPILVGQVRNRKDLDKMNRILDSLRTKSNLSVMKGDNIKALEWRMTPDQFEKAIRYHDAKIMIGLLVPTLLLSQENVGARALGDTHLEIFLLRLKSIQNELKEVIKSVIRIMVDFNFTGVDKYPEIVFREMSAIDKLNLAKMLEILISAEIVAPSESWIRKHLGIPENTTKNVPVPEGPRNIPDPVSPDEDLSDEPTKRLTTTKHRFAEDADDLLRSMEKSERDMAIPLLSYLRRVEEEIIPNTQELMNNPDSLKIPNPTDKQMENTTDAMDNAYKDSYNSGEELLNELRKEAPEQQIQTLNQLQEPPAFFPERTVYVYETLGNSLHTRMADVLENALTEGFTLGEVEEQLGKVLDNTRVSSNGIKAITRTNINMAYNRARLDLYRANDDFVKGLEYSAIIDKGTTPFCDEHNEMTMALDDPRVDELTPPNHMQCRSLWVAVTILDDVDDWTWKDGETSPDDGFLAESITVGDLS